MCRRVLDRGLREVRDRDRRLDLHLVGGDQSADVVCGSGQRIERRAAEELRERAWAELLRQEAQKKGLDKSAEYKSEMDAYAARLLANFYVRDWMRANPVSDAQLRAEYDKLVAQLARQSRS